MNEIAQKTGYEWCLEGNIRLLKLSQWPTEMPFYEESYFTEKIDVETFYNRISKCDVKPNSMPRKTPMYMEYRMYGLVPYQFSNTAHVGIQFGHAVRRYVRTVKGIEPFESLEEKWAEKDETFIILNGGTTNLNPERLGTLNKHLATLRANGVLVQDFYEIDLGDQLTAICFLVDERVFNRELYPDFNPETLPYSKRKPSEKAILELAERNLINYKHWVEKIGGPTNAFLREFLRPLRKA